jgi:predicted nucleotidyltransferase
MPVEPAELAELLELLLDASVEFILVGGGAAVIHGAPVTTQDIDIVHSRRAENVERLLQVLSGLDARLVDPAGRNLTPGRLALSGPGQLLIRTRLGRVDVLGALHDGRGYEELLRTAETVDFEGRSLRIIDLHSLIEIKSGTGRAKDRLVVPVLLALARQRAGGQD